MSPLYEYRCPAGHVSSVVCRHKEKPEQKTCGGGCEEVAVPILSKPGLPDVKGGTPFHHGRPQGE